MDTTTTPTTTTPTKLIPVQSARSTTSVAKEEHGKMTTVAAAAPPITTGTTVSSTQNASLPQYHIASNGMPPGGGSKYNQLVALIEELGKDIRPTYTGNRSSAERLKRAIGHARILTRECILEIEKNARQQQQQQQ